MKFEGRWFFCDLCDTVAIKCDVCGNTSCNGGGCPECDADFEEVTKMINEGTVPPKEGLEVHSKKEDINKFFREKPIIVCLCGSTRFKDEYIKAQREETLKGKIVLSVGLWGHIEGLDMNGPTKKMLDELHLRKIDLADEVLFLNVGDYMGESTRRELAYAREKGKTVLFLEDSAEE